MAPTTAAPTPATPVIRHADATAPRTLATRPAAGLARARAGHGSGGRRCGAGGSGGAARRPQSRPAAGGDARRRTAARRGRRRDRQDPGHHPPDRLADRHAARQAVGDPRPDVHRQGRRGDGGPRRPARAVRLHGHRDLDVPCLRRQPHPGLRAGARAADRPAGADPCPRSSSSCASTCSSSTSTCTGRSATRPASWPRSRRCSAAARTRTSHRPTTWRTRIAWPSKRHGSPRPRPGRSPAATAEAPPRSPPAEEAARQRELAGAYATYQRLLAAKGCIDFGDQVALALRLVRTSAAARTAIAGRFRYILVDEFQDTNRAQAELVAALADGHRNVTVVGDDDQAIYAFRGAAVDNILAFSDRYPGARTVVLRRNYRSLAPVLDAAYRLVRFNDPDRLEVRAGIVKRLRAQRVSPTAAPVRLEVFASGAEEADWLAAEIGRRIEDGAAPRDHAILVRANGHADPILRALNMAGIPWRFSGTSGLYARPEVRLLLAFLRAVADLESSVDVYALAASDVYGLGGEDLTAIVNMARRRNRSVWAILDEVDRQPGILRLAPRRGPPSIDSSRTCAATPRRHTRGRPASSCTASCAASGILGPAGRHGHAGRRGAAPEHRALLRDRPVAVGAARRRSGRLRRAAPRHAHRGRRRPGHRRARPRCRRGRRADRPQGEGPRVPGRLPARDGRRPLPVGRPGRRPGAPGRARSRAADRPPNWHSPRSVGCATSR